MSRKLTNPLALAVLALLGERPMHPYEMSSTLRERSKESSIKLNYGSLYSVVEMLAKNGLVEVSETVKEGRRPERTIYAITEDGRARLINWLSEILSVPVKEYTQFEAALSLLACLPPDEVLRLLRVRMMRVSAEIVGTDAVLAEMAQRGLPRLFAIEGEYVQALRRAELDFVTGMVRELAEGTMDGQQIWATAHEGVDIPSEHDWIRAGGEIKLFD